MMLGLLFIISTSVINAQKTVTFEEMKTISKGMFENIECDVYVGKDGHSYKVKDTLKFGRPSTTKSLHWFDDGQFAKEKNTPIFICIK